jgi:hypothetical protein
MLFDFLAMPAGAIANWFDRRFHRGRDLESPVPHAVQAKTDSLGRRRQKRAKNQTGIVDPQQSGRLAITDSNSEIQPKDAGLEGR